MPETETRLGDSASPAPEYPQADLVRVRILPGGRMDTNNAAKYLNRSPKTLANWRMQRRGPPYQKVEGRIEYFIQDLDLFIAKSAMPMPILERPPPKRRGRPQGAKAKSHAPEPALAPLPQR
jgi:hypothetical protein